MAVTFLIAVFVLTAGFAKIMAMCVNWICAQRLPKTVVIADKGVNLILVVGYPLLLMCGLGWNGPRFLMNSPTWQTSQIAPHWWILIGLGIVGVISLSGAAVRYWLYSPPACELSATCQRIDLRTVTTAGSSWRDVLVGTHGAMRQVALLPGNEQFTIDVCTKTYGLRNLPRHWDGLSIVHLSDFHYYGGATRAYFEMVCAHAAALQPDLFVFSGDLLDDQRLMEWLPETLGRLNAPLGQYFVLGNHDWYLEPDATRRVLESLGWTDLTSGIVMLPPRDSSANLQPIVLCGDETPWMGTHPDLDDVPADLFRILVSHTPDNIGWARERGIDLMLSGHTHGGQIRLPVLGPIYSPSHYGCRYSAGVFWLEPTLMYVSRGVSGREPIRYNCAPEVTKLVLKRTA